MTGFHAHRHTSLLTRLRTHRLPSLIPAQHPETKARLLSAEVHLDILVLRSWSDTTTNDVKVWKRCRIIFQQCPPREKGFYLRNPPEKLSLARQDLKKDAGSSD